jgi:hypothetical protein
VMWIFGGLTLITGASLFSMAVALGAVTRMGDKLARAEETIARLRAEREEAQSLSIPQWAVRKPKRESHLRGLD